MFLSDPPLDCLLVPDSDDTEGFLAAVREVLREMRHDRQLRDIPVVILTASNAEHAELEALHADAFLTKPVDFARLVQVVRSVASLGFTIVKLPV